ncbi:hypothetical protein BT63DRAFT_444139 [Microthyrium microscopicum]|uniref:Uncharacterized protein n=1 Tax=Microthyrium microscopicum TaxID=703497 RepID=A0A6A6TU80_9PEZI|nr:hypothetical protein BT63DRAFT_444139 [Microthyrium microscopicum]
MARHNGESSNPPLPRLSQANLVAWNEIYSQINASHSIPATYSHYTTRAERAHAYYTDLIVRNLPMRWQNNTPDPQTDEEWDQYYFAVSEAQQILMSQMDEGFANSSILDQAFIDHPMQRFLFINSADSTHPWMARQYMREVGITDGQSSNLEARQVPYEPQSEERYWEGLVSLNSGRNYEVETGNLAIRQRRDVRMRRSKRRS